MKIVSIDAKPLLIPNKQPFHWAHGVVEHACVVLIEVKTDTGIVGYGECIGTPTVDGLVSFLKAVEHVYIGRSVFENARLFDAAYHALFQAHATCSSPRAAGQILAGLELALWDAAGKGLGRPAHELLGGAVRDEIQYFGFVQGDSADENAADAKRLADEGYDVIYVKVGRGDALDYDIVSQVRAAIGPTKRLRLDPNEHWTAERATRMIRRLAHFDIDTVEQPTHAESLSALKRVQGASPVAIAADQIVFTPFDAFDVCAAGAADLIVLGVHETGGLLRLAKAAHIAEAAGVNICLHGLHETGITACAGLAVGATIPNLDDGNQIMTQLLAWDIVKTPSLTPVAGRLPILNGPGLGFELDFDAVDRARSLYAKKFPNSYLFN